MHVFVTFPRLKSRLWSPLFVLECRAEGWKIVVDALLTVEDLSAHLVVPVATIYVWNSRGTGPKRYRLGKHVRYRRSDVDAWVEAQAASAATRPGMTSPVSVVSIQGRLRELVNARTVDEVLWDNQNRARFAVEGLVHATTTLVCDSA